MKYSFVIPVYNRPDEAEELLRSLSQQTLSKDYFEVIIVEDGSEQTCEKVCDTYRRILNIHYYKKENGGPGPARNFGVERAQGEYVIILDSDVVLPRHYLDEVNGELAFRACDAFGGPDRAHESFTQMQKAISYSMTSFFTTGGIRGGRKNIDKFFPRSFNMGIRRDVYLELGGFQPMRFGEDIDFSYRIIEAGYTTRLFSEAWVWHKRRTDLDKFFKQVYNSGIARINLGKRHPGTTHLVHTLPMVFTLSVIALLVLAIILRLCTLSQGVSDIGFLGIPASLVWLLPLAPVLLFILLIFLDSSIRNHSMVIGFLSVEAAFVQLFGYGFGFMKAWWVRNVLKRGEFYAFEKNFYE